MKKLPLVCNIIFSTIFVCSAFYFISTEYNKHVERQKFEQLKQETSQNTASSQIEEKTNVQQKKRKVEQLIEELLEESANNAILQLQKSSKIPEESSEIKPQILKKYEELYSLNNDLYGWIKIDNTLIDYPVMQTVENQNYYLSKNFEKQDSRAGVPFVDEQVTANSNNVIVYGHSFADGTMFTDLLKYKDEEFYNNHQYIKFDTLYEEATYQIICVSKTIAYYEWSEAKSADYYFYFHINMDSKEEFDEYVKKAKENAWFDTNVSAEYGDELLTLSTCDYWTDDARILVIAKKVK